VATLTETLEVTRVLITVMTFPHPSQKYNELLCTGGITETGAGCVCIPSTIVTAPATSSSASTSG
jgi:hypothetical protein